jgi:hypothetical protein
MAGHYYELLPITTTTTTTTIYTYVRDYQRIKSHETAQYSKKQERRLRRTLSKRITEKLLFLEGPDVPIFPELCLFSA